MGLVAGATITGEHKFIEVKPFQKVPEGIVYTCWEMANGERNEFAEFPSLFDFIEMVEEGRKPEYGWENMEYYDQGTDSWTYGTHTNNIEKTKEALYYCNPPQPILDRIEELRTATSNLHSIQQLAMKARSIKRRRVFAESGDDLDIDRILCGDPEHWSRMTKGRSNNVVRLWVNFSVSCGNGEDNMYKLAATIAVASDLLTKAGFAVEVLACEIAKDAIQGQKGGFNGVIFPLKRAEDPLEINKIACIGIPGLFRAYAFTATSNIYSKGPASGLGMNVEVNKSVKEFYDFKHLITLNWTEGEQALKLGQLLEDVSTEFMDVDAHHDMAGAK
jgi:hypothetical protein